MGAFLLDAEVTSNVIAKPERQIMEPEASYETEGFFENVVFTCGCLVEGDRIAIYYGAADDKICRADLSVSELLAAMKAV